MYIKNILDNFKKYSFLLKQLVARDFKVKYKRSVLGVLWSLLYPVLMMADFNVFKFSVPGVNYLVYLMTGLTFFNYYNEASNLAMSSVVGNFSLLNKIYIPKYIFPLSNNTDTSWVAPPILWCFHGPFGFSETKICIPIPLMFENM